MIQSRVRGDQLPLVATSTSRKHKFKVAGFATFILTFVLTFFFLETGSAWALTNCAGKLGSSDGHSTLPKISFKEISRPEPGSIFSQNLQTHIGLLELLSQMRRKVTQLSGADSKVTSAKELFDAGIQLRGEVVAGLQRFGSQCKTLCSAFQRELESVLARINTGTQGLLLREAFELDRIQQVIDGHEFGQPLRNVIADLLGQFSELFTFGLIPNPRRGVVIRNYLAKMMDREPKEVMAVIRANRIEERLIAKEIDLMNDADRVWVEVKALDTSERTSFLWKKVKTQMVDHLVLMKLLARGINDQSTGRNVKYQAPVRKLRYFFLGKLSSEASAELQQLVETVLARLDRDFGGPSLEVEINFIPIAAN